MHNSVGNKTKSIRPRQRPRPKLQDQDQDRGRSETSLVIRSRGLRPQDCMSSAEICLWRMVNSQFPALTPLPHASFFNFYETLQGSKLSHIMWHYRCSRSLCSLWNCAVKLTMRKLESWAILQWRPHDRSWSRFDTVPACDRQTDGQTDGFTIANTELCLASYADQLTLCKNVSTDAVIRAWPCRYRAGRS